MVVACGVVNDFEEEVTVVDVATHVLVDLKKGRVAGDCRGP